MTPPGRCVWFVWVFCFPGGFLETGAQQLPELARIYLCPDFAVHSFMQLE